MFVGVGIVVSATCSRRQGTLHASCSVIDAVGGCVAPAWVVNRMNEANLNQILARWMGSSP